MRRAREWAWWRAFAIGGLALLLSLLLLGSLLPDPSQLDAASLADLAATRPITLAIASVFPAGRILGSPWLVALPIALGLAILWNLGERMAERFRARSPAPAGAFRGQVDWATPSAPGAEVERLRTALLRRGFRIEESAADGAALLVGRRGVVGFWGSIAFHLALVATLAAIVLTMLAEWRGTVALVERRPVALDTPGVMTVARRGPLAPPLPHVVLELARAEVRVVDERFPIDYRAEVEVLERSGALRRGVVRVNQPLVADGGRFVLQRYGLAPVIEVRRAGEPLLSAPVALSVLEGHEDGFDLPGTRARIRVRWFGDAMREGGGVRSRSDEPRNPALGLTLDEVGVTARPVLALLGEEVALGPYRVAFRELRRWVELGVDRDPGTPVLFGALVLAALGLAIRFWDHEREVRLRVAEDGGVTRVAASCRSRYFPALMRRDIAELRPRP